MLKFGASKGRRNHLRRLLLGTAAVAAFGIAAPAHAAFIANSSLNFTNDSALGSGPFGNVQISLTGLTALFTFTAASGYGFVDSNVADLNLIPLAPNYVFQPIISTTPGLTQTGSGNVDGEGSMN